MIKYECWCARSYEYDRGGGPHACLCSMNFASFECDEWEATYHSAVWRDPFQAMYKINSKEKYEGIFKTNCESQMAVIDYYKWRDYKSVEL